MSICSWKCSLLIILLFIGVVILFLGIIGLLILPKFIKHMVKQQEYLGIDANGTDNLMLKMFRDPPYDMKLQVWTISVQNPEAVVVNGEIPRVVEKGPYTFNIIMHKTGIKFQENETHLFFRQQKTYFYNASQSCVDCKLTDKVTVPNILFQKIVDIAGKSIYLRLIIEPLIKDRERVFITLTTEELLFKGYEDALIKLICDHQIIAPLCKSFNIPERIGLFYGQNNTDDGIYEVDTGKHDSNLLDRVYSWEGMDNLTERYWYNDSARMINGTEELFPPNLYGVDKLQFFIGQLCRSIILEKQKATIAYGLSVFRYIMPHSLLDVDTQRSQGFCNPNSPDYFHNSSIQQGGCAPSGLLDMSSCLPGNPRIYWSGSHFWSAPSELRFNSMATPSDEADLSYFDIEPITGVIVAVQQRSQLNLGMLNLMTKNMPDLIMPIIWINESVAIDPGTKSRLLIPVTILSYSFTVGLILIVIGTLCLVTCTAVFIGTKISLSVNSERRFTAVPELNDDNLNATIGSVDSRTALLNSPQQVSRIHDTNSFPQQQQVLNDNNNQ